MDALETAPASLPDRVERSQLGAIALKKKVFCLVLFVCPEFTDIWK